MGGIACSIIKDAMISQKQLTYQVVHAQPYNAKVRVQLKNLRGQLPPLPHIATALTYQIDEES